MVDLSPVGMSLALAIALSVVAIWRPHVGLTAFLLLGLLTDLLERWSQTSFRYLDEFAIPLLVVVTLVVHHRRLHLPRPGVRELGLGSLFAAGLISTVAGEVPSSVWLPAVGLLAKGFLFFYLVLSLPITERSLTGVVRTWLIAGVAIAVVGLLQFFVPGIVDTFDLPVVEQQRGDIAVVNAIFSHPALYGWLAAFLSLFMYARFVVLREPWAIVAALILNVASVLSGRRTPIVGVVAGLLAGGVRHWVSGGQRSRQAWMAVAVAGAATLAISIPLLGDFYRATAAEYGERWESMSEVLSPNPDALVISDLQPRTALYLGSVAIARDEFPLGSGLGRFGSHMSREAYSPEYEEYGLHRIWGLAPHMPNAVTDTFWPMVLGETGVLGLSGALVFFGALAHGLWRAAGAPRSPSVRAFTLGALMVFGETAVRSFTSAVFVAPPIAYVIFGTFALALAASRDLATEADDGAVTRAEQPLRA